MRLFILDGLLRPDFDPQLTLQGGSLLLRPLAADDQEPLFAVAKDPAVWAGHPAKDRYKREVFEPYFNTLLASGGTLAVCRTKDGHVIGCSRYYEAPDHPESISIGYTFLGRAFWGGQTNHAMKSLMLTHAYDCVDTVWFHIDPTNIRSQKATERLGAVLVSEGPLTLSGNRGVWQSWRLDQDAWERTKSVRAT
ncbi:MAG: GNAT family N-acetyltransferase [Sulfitobacter sp.]|nr:GNAT family N-acetyltransferase [Sulfitobacter sp.]